MIIFDLPIQLGYFILQYAKLRMLQFYYDFMDSHVNRKDFNIARWIRTARTCLFRVLAKKML